MRAVSGVGAGLLVLLGACSVFDGTDTEKQEGPASSQGGSGGAGAGGAIAGGSGGGKSGNSGVGGNSAGNSSAGNASAGSSGAGAQGNPEVCSNGLDDNGNGKVDEGCPCDQGQTQSCFTSNPAQAGKGACVFGQQTCVFPDGGAEGSGQWGPCKGEGVPSVEGCNGQDDDCDGTVDNGCDCSAPQECTTACGKGTQPCVNGKLGACSASQPSAEICDGKDNNCDGKIDEGLTQPCSTACGPGVMTCQGGNFSDCSAPQPSAEVCGDGKDNDCNGQTDEECGCKDGEKQSCSTSCGSGTQLCQGGSWGACSAPFCCNGQKLCEDNTCALCCGDGDCSGGQLCQGGNCSCPVGQKLCQGQCIPQSGCCEDADCSGGKSCNSSSHSCSCEGGTKDCGSFCGLCCSDSECSGGKTCQGGNCSCPAAVEDCTDNKDNDCDGLVDCDDPDCDGFSFDYEFQQGYAGPQWLNGGVVNGLCAKFIQYCSLGGPIAHGAPAGYLHDGSTQDNCGFNGCNIGGKPHFCQENFCRDCGGLCEDCPSSEEKPCQSVCQ